MRAPDRRRCRVIDANAAPALTGDGAEDYACGSCGTVLLAAVAPRLVRDVAVRCPACGSCNDVPPDRPGP